jgi:hypothetical protein
MIQHIRTGRAQILLSALAVIEANDAAQWRAALDAAIANGCALARPLQQPG